MATIINNPANQGNDEGFGIGLIIGILIVTLMGILFFVYGLPILRGTEVEKPAIQKIEIQLPATIPTPVPTE